MKKQMISFKQDGYKFNFRVAAIIYNEDRTKVLVLNSPGVDFCVLPGGRVDALESSEQSIIREMQEELNLDIKAEIAVVFESFFELFDVKYHEIAHYYFATSINDESIYGKDGYIFGNEDKDRFKWVSLEDLEGIDFRPKALIETIINNDTKLKHLVFNEL